MIPANTTTLPIIFSIVITSLNIRNDHSKFQITTTPLFEYAFTNGKNFNTCCHSNAYMTNNTSTMQKKRKKGPVNNPCDAAVFDITDTNEYTIKERCINTYCNFLLLFKISAKSIQRSFKLKLKCSIA